MVSKVIVVPESVRGGGNIVSPTTASDYTGVLSIISQTTDTVGEVSTTVYQMTYNGTIFLLTVTSSIVASGSTVTVSVQLTDENGDPIENASISLYKVT